MNVINVREQGAAESAAHALQKLFDKVNPRSVLFLVSGDSSLSVLDARRKWRLPKKMTLSLVDERLTADLSKRNWTPFAQTTLFKQARRSKKTFFNPLNRGLKKTDVYFGTFLKQWLSRNENKEVVVLVGVGGDGHTGAIFPHKNKTRFKRDFLTERILAKAYTAQNAPVSKKRLTVTLSFIVQHADHVIVFAIGKEKDSIVAQVTKGKVFEHEMPAVALMKLPQTLLYTTIPR